MEKINKEQINKLLNYMRKYNLMQEWVYKMCCVNCITDITVVQYNSLLVIIEQVVDSCRKGLKIELI